MSDPRASCSSTYTPERNMNINEFEATMRARGFSAVGVMYANNTTHAKAVSPQRTIEVLAQGLEINGCVQRILELSSQEPGVGGGT